MPSQRVDILAMRPAIAPLVIRTHRGLKSLKYRTLGQRPQQHRELHGNSQLRSSTPQWGMQLRYCRSRSPPLNTLHWDHRPLSSPIMSQYSDLELVFHTPQEIESSKATLDEWRNDQTMIGALQTLSVRSWWCDPKDSAYQDLIKSLTEFFESGKSRLQNFQTLK